MTTLWQPPNVVRRDQPLGNRGAQASLEEVARRATEGRLDNLVVAWARRVINETRPLTECGKAAALLDAQRRQVVYVPDPVHAEHMSSARITLAVSQGGDCDDVTILYLAACMAIGLRCQVAGHGYDDDHTIQHVLARVYCDGGWHYAEPSVMDVPFGQLAKEPTMKRFLDLPVVPGRRPVTLCSGASCDLSSLAGAEPSPMSHAGDFVGVGALARSRRLHPGLARAPRATAGAALHPALARAPRPARLAALGGLFDVASPDASGEVSQAHGDLSLAWSDLARAHDQAVNDAEVAGLPFPDPASGGPLGWSVDDEKRYALLGQVHQTLSGGLLDALAGVRKIVQDSVSNLLGISALPSDAVVFSTDATGHAVLTSVATGQSISLDTDKIVCASGYVNNPAFRPGDPNDTNPACIPAPGSAVAGLGALPALPIIAGVLALIAVVYAVVQVMRDATEQARIAANAARDKRRADLLARGITTPAEENAFDQNALDKTKAEADLAKASNVPQSYANLVKDGAIFLAVAAGVWIVYRLASSASASSNAGPRIDIINETRARPVHAPRALPAHAAR